VCLSVSTPSGVGWVMHGFAVAPLGVVMDDDKPWSVGTRDDSTDIVVDLERTHGQTLFGFVRRLGISDAAAADVVQESLVRLFDVLVGGQQIVDAKAWLFHAAYRLAMENIVVSLASTGSPRGSNRARPPDGWAVANDTQAALFLRRASDYSNHTDSFYGISAWADVAAAKQDCSDQSDATIGTGAANIAAWMQTLPSIIATHTTIDVNGLPAEVVDVHIAPGATTCQRFVSLIASRTSKPDPFNFGVFGDQQMRVVLIDVAPQRTVAVFIDDNLEHSYDELAAAAMPIIKSFTFAPTPT
jgi:hypothetical protein